MNTYQPLPARLTAPIAEPAPPPAHCTFQGIAAVCVADALAWIEAWRGTLAQANADRATAARITTPAGATP